MNTLLSGRAASCIVGKSRVTVSLEINTDDELDYPWLDCECDGYGVVSDWTKRNKEPEERLLAHNMGLSLFYNVRDSMEKAHKEGWSLPDDARNGLSSGQIIEQAVERDFEHCKKWAEGDLCYNTFTLRCYVDGEEIAQDSLSGIPSDATKSDMHSVIGELAANIETELRGKAQIMAAFWNTLAN